MVTISDVKTKLIQKYNALKLYISTLGAHKREKICCSISSLRLYQPLYLYLKGGRYKIGHNVQFGYDIGGRYKKGYCELQARTENAEIIIGDYTAINNNFLAVSCEKIEIGKYCRIGIGCQIMDFDAHNIDPFLRSQMGKKAEIIIGENVWIGNNVIVLPGVHIGNNSIVGAGAVVTRDIPCNVVCGGVPAKVIKSIV